MDRLARIIPALAMAVTGCATASSGVIGTVCSSDPQAEGLYCTLPDGTDRFVPWRESEPMVCQPYEDHLELIRRAKLCQ